MIQPLMDAFKGVLSAVISSLFIGVLFAFIFRIPIPVVGYVGPFGELSPSQFDFSSLLESLFLSWFLYGTLGGGFIVLAVLGAGTGVLVGSYATDTRWKNLRIVAASVAVGFMTVLFLAVSDYIMGS